MRRCLILCIALAAAIATGDGRAAEADPAFEANAPTVFLPFLDGADQAGPLINRPHLRLSAGGPALPALVDTGSTGVAISADRIPDLDRLPQLGPGTLTYNGSFRILRGRWVEVPVTLEGGGGAKARTVPMPVLAVDELACIRVSDECRPRRQPKSIAIIGVGFARGSDFPPPAASPFLRVEGMGTSGQPGPMRRGYIVTRHGVRLGLSAADTTGFAFRHLPPSTQPYPSAQTPGCIAIDGGTPACGQLLMDTGANVMFLRVPGAKPRQRVDATPGTRVTVTVPGISGLSYDVRAGDASPLTPRRIIFAGPPNPQAFVNTSFHLLNGYDYLYDAEGGFVGFRTHPLR